VSDVIILEAIPETVDVVAPPDARHQPRKGRPAMLSNITPIVELAARHHAVTAYASGRVDGAPGEDGLDGERCVVINCIPQLLLCERRSPSCALGRQNLRSWARPPGTPPG
jgi:hypothetical protein